MRRISLAEAGRVLHTEAGRRRQVRRVTQALDEARVSSPWEPPTQQLLADPHTRLQSNRHASVRALITTLDYGPTSPPVAPNTWPVVKLASLDASST